MRERFRGKGSKDEAAEEQEKYEDREHTRHATGSKLEETARHQRLAQEQVCILHVAC